MPLETVWLCRDLDVSENEWSLIRVTRRFSARAPAVCLCALVSGQAPGSIIPFKVDVFRISSSGGESVLSHPARYELEIRSTWPQILAVRITLPEPLIAGEHYATLDLLGEYEVVPFDVEEQHAS